MVTKVIKTVVPHSVMFSFTTQVLADAEEMPNAMSLFKFYAGAQGI
jgi:hypothetical protein